MTRGQTITKAIELKEDADVVARIRQRMPDALEELDRIACGNVKRNDATVLAGIRTMLDFTQPRPKTVVEHQGAVGVAVIDPYATPPADVIDGEVVAPLALPVPVVAKPPIVRKAAK